MRAFLARCRLAFFVGLLVQSQLQIAKAGDVPHGWGAAWIGIRPGQTMFGLDRVTYFDPARVDGKGLSEIDHGRQRSLVIYGTTDATGAPTGQPDFATFEPLIVSSPSLVGVNDDLVYAVAQINGNAVQGWFFSGVDPTSPYPYEISLNTKTKYYSIRSASGSLLIITKNVEFCDVNFNNCAVATTTFPSDPHEMMPKRKEK